MNLIKIFFLVLYSMILMSVYAGSLQAAEQVPVRWYTKGQVLSGDKIYHKYCVECHQSAAKGVASWQSKDESGHYPAPPLNGQGHTFHHKLDNLRRAVREGGLAHGGTMPAFSGKLSDQQIDEVLAWVQSNWPDELYIAWLRWRKQDRK